MRLGITSRYFAEKNDSTTIKIIGYNKDEVLNIGSRPRFGVKYVLAEDVQEE
jgi:hypothetical protein